MLFGRNFAILLFLLLSGNAAPAHPALIPMPTSTVWKDGTLALGAGTPVDGQGQAAPTAAVLARQLGLKQGNRGAARIRLMLVPIAKLPDPESYRLRSSNKGVIIEASDPRGLFYGAQTLRQLVTDRSIPSVDISDIPRFRWRGLLIDLGRHFFGKQTLFQIIDEMSAYKLNVLKL